MICHVPVTSYFSDKGDADWKNIICSYSHFCYEQVKISPAKFECHIERMTSKKDTKSLRNNDDCSHGFMLTRCRKIEGREPLKTGALNRPK